MQERRVTIEGTARDAKAGAVVVTDKGAIYVEKLESWPSALQGRKVRVTGVLVTEKLIPDPINERGELVQGAVGDQTLLRGATWTAV